MNKLSAIALGAALSIAAPLAVNAQDTDLDLNLDGDVGVELGGDSETGLDVGVGADADAGVSVGSDFDVDTLTHADVDAAIQSSGSVNLDDVDAATDIRIVTLSSLSANDGGDASVLSDTRAAYEADISALRSNVSANADVTAALEAEGYTADDVVAVWTHGSGAVVLFVDA